MKESPRGKGVTILIGRQILFTQPPTHEDEIFMATVIKWVTEYYEGMPQK